MAAAWLESWRAWLNRQPSVWACPFSVALGIITAFDSHMLFRSSGPANGDALLMASMPLILVFCFWLLTGSRRAAWFGAIMLFSHLLAVFFLPTALWSWFGLPPFPLP